ncbi:MAG: dTMP kinase [Firmicutes bacterium]|nr:dTMP kinase [Bacillota bacterium]
MQKGVFITFEGIDGVGKSTQARMLKEALIAKGIEVLLTFEPGATNIGRAIRQVLLNVASKEMAYQTEILLYAADRAQHVKEVIKPTLELGITVISDRYIDSSIAYQGYGLGWDRQSIIEINDWASGGIKPDITFCLDLEPQKALLRTKGDRIESRTLEYHNRVRQGFQAIAEQEPERFHLIPATGSANAIHQKILAILEKRMGLK